MIDVTNEIKIDENEIKFQFIKASGPGGQNVNKVATAVQLRFDVMNSPSLPDDVRARLIRLAGRASRGNILLSLINFEYRTLNVELRTSFALRL